MGRKTRLDGGGGELTWSKAKSLVVVRTRHPYETRFIETEMAGASKRPWEAGTRGRKKLYLFFVSGPVGFRRGGFMCYWENEEERGSIS